LRVWDPSTDRTIPRGKQYWKEKSERIWYTRTTGIWQPVWIEAVDAVHVKRLRITPDVDRSQVGIEVLMSRVAPELRLRIAAKKDGALQARAELDLSQTRSAATLALENQQLWSPERPNLYDLSIEVLSAGKVLDKVDSYLPAESGRCAGKFI
jgi:beta-galactosidase/beta-glucuronidase